MDVEHNDWVEYGKLLKAAINRHFVSVNLEFSESYELSHELSHEWKPCTHSCTHDVQVFFISCSAH